MPITSFDGYLAARKQLVTYAKSGTKTVTAAKWLTMFDLAGNPGAGTLAGSSQTAGVVPVAGDAGFPKIASVGSQRAYLSLVDLATQVASRFLWFDMLWKGGAYPFNASVTLSAQPSYASRLVLDPDGQPSVSIYDGTQIWLEQVTNSTGIQTVTVTYTNQAGVTGRTTGAFVTETSAMFVGQMVMLPLQAGDSGVQKIESVTGSVATGGTYNILVMRPLGGMRLSGSNGQDVMGIDRTGMPLIFDTSALYVVDAPDSGTTGTTYGLFEVASA